MTELLMGLNENVHDRLRNRNRLFKFSDVLQHNCNVLVTVEEVCSHVPKSEKLNAGQRASECIQLDPNGSSVGHCGLIKYISLADESFSSSANT